MTPTVAHHEFRHAETAADVAACLAVLQQLRPKLTDATALVAQIGRQRQQGYRLLAAWHGATVEGIAGYRLSENLVHGRFVYVDDLAVLDQARRNGLGARLLDAVGNAAMAADFPFLVLDTGIANEAAQRFYRRYGLRQTALNFSRPLAP